MERSNAEKQQHVEEVLFGTLDEVYKNIKARNNWPEQLSVLVDSTVKLADCISRLNRQV